MATSINHEYDTLLVEAQVRFLTKTPDGKDFWIETGMQFKWVLKLDTPSACYSCGGQKYSYLIDAYAHCERGTLFEDGKGVYVPAEKFIETDVFRYPPVFETIEYQVYRRYIAHEKPPHLRTKDENRAWESRNYNALPRTHSQIQQGQTEQTPCFPCRYSGVKGLI